MFMAFLSISLYKKVICHFLVSGHSHMCPDRVVSHVKKSFGVSDLFHPSQMIERMNSIRSVDAVWIDHNDPIRPLFCGWDIVLKEHMKVIPSVKDGGYTKSHFFEFADGQVVARDTVASDIKFTHSYVPAESVSLVSHSILKAIIGQTELSKASVADVILKRHPTYELPESKVESLREKYFAIPSEFYSYYPAGKEAKKDVVEDSVGFAIQRAHAAVGKKLGRPPLAFNTEIKKVY